MLADRKYPLSLAGLFGLYVLAGKLGLSLASVHASVSPVWPPTGIAIAAFLTLGYRVWPAILAGAFVVNVSTAGSPATSVAIALGNTRSRVCSARISSIATRTACGRSTTRRTFFKFAALAGLLSEPGQRDRSAS